MLRFFSYVSFVSLWFSERDANHAVHRGEHQGDPAPPGGDSPCRKHRVHDGWRRSGHLQIRLENSSSPSTVHCFYVAIFSTSLSLSWQKKHPASLIISESFWLCCKNLLCITNVLMNVWNLSRVSEFTWYLWKLWVLLFLFCSSELDVWTSGPELGSAGRSPDSPFHDPQGGGDLHAANSRTGQRSMHVGWNTEKMLLFYFNKSSELFLTKSSKWWSSG